MSLFVAEFLTIHIIIEPTMHYRMKEATLYIIMKEQQRSSDISIALNMILFLYVALNVYFVSFMAIKGHQMKINGKE